MAVYVDPLTPHSRVGRHVNKLWCHLSADTDAELEEFARLLELNPNWKQRGHYDITASRRHTAVLLGAIEITSREMVEVRNRCVDSILYTITGLDTPFHPNL